MVCSRLVVGSATGAGASPLTGVADLLTSSAVDGVDASGLVASLSALAARLGRRKILPSLFELDLGLLSLSVASLPLLFLRSFFPPKVPNSEVRRFSLTASGVLVVAGTTVS